MDAVARGWRRAGAGAIAIAGLVAIAALAPVAMAGPAQGLTVAQPPIVAGQAGSWLETPARQEIGAQLAEEGDFIAVRQTKKQAKQRQQRRTAGECRPWCARDTLPCDPPDFKIADGRCDPRDAFW